MRKKGMIQLAAPFQYVDTWPNPAGRTSVRRRDRTKGRAMVSETKELNDAHDLTRAMLAVRDQRSRADFAQLFGHFAPRLKGWLMRAGLNAAQAEDCVQETMVTLWHKADLFDPTRAGVSTWVFTIARNKKIDALRKTRRPEPDDLPWQIGADDVADDAAAAIEVQQESETLQTALATLPVQQRELVEKAYFGELSHSEIAAETGLPLGTIKSRIRLGLDRLRHAMMTVR